MCVTLFVGRVPAVRCWICVFLQPGLVFAFAKKTGNVDVRSGWAGQERLGVSQDAREIGTHIYHAAVEPRANVSVHTMQELTHRTCETVQRCFLSGRGDEKLGMDGVKRDRTFLSPRVLRTRENIGGPPKPTGALLEGSFSVVVACQARYLPQHSCEKQLISASAAVCLARLA